jgi:FlgD Ig-like domain
MLIAYNSFIPVGKTDVLEITGDFELTKVEATEILSDGTVDYIRPRTISGRVTGGIQSFSYGLDDVFPNPANPTSSIRFSIPARAKVVIEVFNVLGQRVAVVANGEYDSGRHTVRWDGVNASGNSVSSGIYFVRMTSGDFVAKKKLVIMK